MVSRFSTFVKKHFALGILGIVFVTLFLLNHSPSTTLLGWDSLATELNPMLGVKRAIFSAWEEYQSFGLLAGMAHGADFVRALSIGLLSLVLPAEAIRYVFHGGMAVLGAVGMYVLLAQVHIGGTNRHHFAAVLGSLLYVLNYGAIQIMSVPFEPFSTFLAFLPWLLWAFLRHIHAPETRSHRTLITLVALNILATPLAYVQTMFVVYGMVLGVVFLAETLQNKHRLTILKRGVIAGALIIGVNLYWILPQAYFVMSGGTATVRQAKINQLSTEDVSLQNREAGTIGSFVKMKGFYSRLQDSEQKPLFEAWDRHFGNPLFGMLPWIVFGVALMGLAQPSRFRGAFAGLFALCAAVWLSPTPEVLGQVFRSPFTKFVAVYGLALSYFFASGVVKLSSAPSRIRRWAITASLTAILLLYALPAFQGHYFADDMRVSIPQEYLQTIEYFQTVDPNQRIALMPDYTFWGWFFTDWGYNGSGFLWYGIEQPIISRTFDVWSEASESYFWEMKTALEAEDVRLMEGVLEKYAVDYVIVDHSLVPVASGAKALQYDRLADMLKQSPKIHQFGFGEKLSLYRFTRSQASNQFVSLGHDLPSAGPYVTNMPVDHAVGPYVTSVYEPADTFYPFRNLMSQTRLYDDQWAVQEFENSFVFAARVPEGAKLPDLYEAPTDMTAELIIDGKPQIFATQLTYELDEETNTLRVTVPKTSVQKIKPSDALSQDAIRDCGQNTNISDRVISATDPLLRIHSINRAVPCVSYELPFLDQRFGYLLSVKNRSLTGQRLFMSLTDKTKGQAYIEDRLRLDNETFLIAPRFEFGKGYTLTFQNTSYEGLPSTNIVDGIDVYILPYRELSELFFGKPQRAVEPLVAPRTVDKRAYHAYTVDLDAQEMRAHDYVVLHQAYHPGWKAFVVAHDGLSQYVPLVAGRALPEESHVRINSWAQGWKLPERCESGTYGCRLVLVFWPQYLQYAGFAVLALIIGGLLYRAVYKTYGSSSPSTSL